MTERYRITITTRDGGTVIWQDERAAREEPWCDQPVPNLSVAGAGPGGAYHGPDGKPTLLTFDDGDDDSRELIRAARTEHDGLAVRWERIITPALAPEQWAAYQAGETIEYLHTENERIRISPTQARPRFPHLSVALGNAALEDGDPRKITLADVERLNRAARNCRATEEHARDTFRTDAMREAREAAEFYESLAAKLASMLPPREG